jgi:hypothetical protein
VLNVRLLGVAPLVGDLAKAEAPGAAQFISLR